MISRPALMTFHGRVLGCFDDSRMPLAFFRLLRPTAYGLIRDAAPAALA